jgi:hypothetical protein
MISATWISQPKVGKTKKPSSHKAKRIIPIISKIFIGTSLSSDKLEFAAMIATFSVYCDHRLLTDEECKYRQQSHYNQIYANEVI